jgi:hypothetical protein
MSDRGVPELMKRDSPAPMPASSNLLQRKCACGQRTIAGGECSECSKDRQTLQRSTSDPETRSPGQVPPIVHEVLRSPGQELDEQSRAFFEPLFDHDFSHVRVHTDQRAEHSARTVNALAYTVGHNVVFGAGQFAPTTTQGRRLLAHELTHVVQQGGSNVFGAPSAISSPNDVGEREAENASQAVATGRSFRANSLAMPALQRQVPPPATLAGLTATRVAFNNTGAPDGANCSSLLPAALGVDGPNAGANGMEMIFRLNGPIPAGTEFDILRTKATGTWERNAAGAWSRLGGDPAGTNDDRANADECLTPVGRRIFVLDTPGMGSLNPRGQVFPDGSTVGATATAAVRKHSFAEWVIARNRPLGINWAPISTPLFHRWHSIVSVAQLGDVFPTFRGVPMLGNIFVRTDTPSGQHNEIALGGIATTGATP